MTAFLKIVNYDKMKFIFLFLDIVKNPPFDLMYILCRFLCDKAYAPLAAWFLFPALLAEETSASREDFNFMKAEA